jgi:UDP-2,4-diacetamido-2,4,6-trideoxy-beta-L-altropyranose hydrolase
MRFIIRADAYRISGAGHVMRSSVIAEELIDRGYEVIFIGDTKEIPWVNEYITSLGFRGIFRPEEGFVTNPISDTLILDSYDIRIEDPFIQPRNWNKTLVLVDDASPSYVADLYIHAGAETSWRIPKSVSFSIFLAGLDYLLIRKSLRLLKNNYKPRESEEIKILVSSGGSDPFGFSKNLVNILTKSNSRFRAFVLAPDFELPYKDKRFELIKLGKEYEEILNDLEFVFTTAGTSSWEYLFLGLPIAIASAVQNQEQNYRYQIDNGLSWDLGSRDLDGIWKFNESLIRNFLTEDWQSKLEKNRNSRVVDGEGAHRILKILLAET